MIFVGFGFLMVFLKTHMWTSVGFNYLIACWVIQLAVILIPFWRMVMEKHWDYINTDMGILINADFCAGAVLITFGVLLGKVSWGQLFFLGTFECFFYCLNLAILEVALRVNDIGGSMGIHTFGAFFGLAASFWFQPKVGIENAQGRCGGGYNSQTLAMIGTLFLFMFWPSFNSAMLTGVLQQRGVVNTYIAISASCLTSCFVATIIKGKFDMEVMLNSTLAGGVAIGACCDMITYGVYSFLIGMIAGTISCLGYLKANASAQSTIKLHDTCGVQFLHGWPGVLGGICSSICAAAIPYFENDNGMAIQSLFPLVKASGCTDADTLYTCRTAHEQAAFQIAALGVTLGIAILSGILFGWIASRIPFPENFFDDSVNFEHVDFNDDIAKYSVENHQHVLDTDRNKVAAAE